MNQPHQQPLPERDTTTRAYEFAVAGITSSSLVRPLGTIRACCQFCAEVKATRYQIQGTTPPCQELESAGTPPSWEGIIGWELLDTSPYRLSIHAPLSCACASEVPQ